jgi:hypothetical protein
MSQPLRGEVCAMPDFKLTEAHKHVLAALYRAAGSANPVRVEAVIEAVIEDVARDRGLARPG